MLRVATPEMLLVVIALLEALVGGGDQRLFESSRHGHPILP